MRINCLLVVDLLILAGCNGVSGENGPEPF